jgi:general secretion pathway protein D
VDVEESEPKANLNGEIPTEDVSFDYDEEPLINVIKAITRLTGKNFDIDPNIANTPVTIITHDKIPPEMAFDVLSSILAIRGFSVVEILDGHMYSIRATPDQLDGADTPLVEGLDEIPPGYDGLSTHIVRVKYADAQEVMPALKILGSKAIHIDAYAPSNMLIITDTANGLRRVFALMDEIDIAGNETSMIIFTLEYTRAEVLSQQLMDILLDTGETTGGRANAPRPQPARPTRPSTRNVPGAKSSTTIGSREEVLRIVSDDRLNALIVVASPGMMESARDLISHLQAPQCRCRKSGRSHFPTRRHGRPAAQRWGRQCQPCRRQHRRTFLGRCYG